MHNQASILSWKFRLPFQRETTPAEGSFLSFVYESLLKGAAFKGKNLFLWKQILPSL